MQSLEVQLYQNWILLVLFSTGAVASNVIRFNSKIYADFSVLLDRLVDGGTVLKQFTLKSRRQCCLECVSLSPCKSVNYKKNGGNCELLGRSFNQVASALQPRSGWTYLSTNQEEVDAGPTCKMLSPCAVGSRCVEQDTASGFKCICDQFHSGTYCENERAYASCKAAYDAGLRTDGIYLLQGMGYHRCRLSALAGCSGGGWTLILKTNGQKTTFNYDASYWTTNNVYNHIYALKYNVKIHGQEAKFPAFNQLSYTKVCIGMRYDGVTKFLETPATETSMLSLMQSGVYKRLWAQTNLESSIIVLLQMSKSLSLNFAGPIIGETGPEMSRPFETNIGRSAWIGLISGSFLQSSCNREGFNNRKNKHVRIGIFGNNENDCLTIDSAIGIGFSSSSFDVYTGNRATRSITRKKASKGFVLVQ
eukprot:gene9159-10132_t